jgi:hypothetical protein
MEKENGVKGMKKEEAEGRTGKRGGKERQGEGRGR